VEHVRKLAVRLDQAFGAPAFRDRGVAAQGTHGINSRKEMPHMPSFIGFGRLEIPRKGELAKAGF
jgi:hypothetical protein